MFYADFYSYKKYGRSISGLSYRAIQYGPVPEHYETVYDHVQGLTKKSFLANADFDYELLFCDKPNISFLSNEDIEIINRVMDVLVDMKRSDVIKMSHEENGWLKNKDAHNIISYNEAYTLKAFSLN